MSITTVGNHLIHYEVLGRGKPLIFIHGWLGSWRYWWPSMQAMSSQYRSFAFDLWGFGDSSKAPEQYTIDAYVEMLHQFIDTLGVAPPVVLIGHSLGGIVATRYTIKYPDSVNKVITVAMPVSGSELNTKLTDTDPDTFLNKIVKSNSFSEVDTELRKTDLAAFNKLASEVTTDNYAPDLVNFPRPLLMLHGGQDAIVQQPAGDNSYLQENEERRFYVSLDDCQHFPMLQEKAKFNRLMLDFIIAGDDLTDLAPKEYWQRRTR